LNNLIIIGVSGHGSVMADIAVKLKYSVKFWDDDLSKESHVYKVEKRVLEDPFNSNLIIGIGDNFIRESISKQYSKDKFISLIHPKATISDNTKIGIGSVVMAGVCINNGSIIGDHCILNTGAVVDHDCKLESYVHVSPNVTLCGNVAIGNSSWVGAGVTIIQGIKVGENVTIGAGAVIIEDVPNGATVVGNPGKIINL